MNFFKNQPYRSFLGYLGVTLLLSKALAMGTSTEVKPSPSPHTATGTFESPLLDDGSQENPCPLTGNITIQGRQILIKGKPFEMKGICYNPVGKGATYPAGLITQNPTPEDIAVIEKDFQMMSAAGINTLRTYEPMVDERILKLLLKYHLRTIVPVLSSYTTSFWNMSSTISLLKDHPSTLIWEVGNEWNYNYFYSKTTEAPEGIGFDQSVSLLENAAHYVRLLDTIHPISTAMGDLPTDTSFWSSLHFKGIDIYAMNVYDGLSFGDRLQRWPLVSTKPLYISECGADAFNTNINKEDDASQEIATSYLITEIQSNLSARNPNHVLVGGCLFEWNDEWWKDATSPPYIHGTGGLPPSVNGPYPDHVFNEAWWGITDIDRNPRPAYYTLQRLYSQP